jgi:hypothetical protein
MSNIVKKSLNKAFNYLSTRPVAIPIEYKRGRIWICSALSNEVICYSWLKLDLTRYCGYEESDNGTKVYFFCNIYKNIFLYKKDFEYIYSSAIKHGNKKTIHILKEYIINRDLNNGIQAKAS